MLAVGHTVADVLEEEDVVVVWELVVELELEVVDWEVLFDVVMGALVVVVQLVVVVLGFGFGFGLHLMPSALPVFCQYG